MGVELTDKKPKKVTLKMTMMYLEDFVELCEDLHGSMKDHLSEITENDKKIESELKSVSSDVQKYHSKLKSQKSSSTSKEEKSTETDKSSDPEFLSIKSRYEKLINLQNTKVNNSTQILKMVEGYLQHLDSETKKFSLDLNANDPLHSKRLLDKANTEMDEQKEKRTEEKRILKAKEKQRKREEKAQELKMIKMLKKSEEYDRTHGLSKPGIWNYSSEVCKLLLGNQKLKQLSLEILIYVP